MNIILLKFVLFITSILPLKLLHIISLGIGNIVWRSNCRIRRITEKNICLCYPQLNHNQQTELAKKTLTETCKVILETGKVWHSSPQKALKLIQSCENEQLIQQAQQQGRGIILAVPHFGSWEMVNLYCSQHYPVTTMYSPQKNPKADSIIKQARQRTGATLVSADTTGIRAMSKALKSKQLSMILPDQSPRENGQFAPFFNQPCYTMTLLPKLAKKTNAVVLLTYAKRLEDSSGFKLVFKETSRDLASLELDDALAQLNSDIESVIDEAPQQYQWTYNRFKKQPEYQV